MAILSEINDKYEDTNLLERWGVAKIEEENQMRFVFIEVEGMRRVLHRFDNGKFCAQLCGTIMHA